MWEEIEEWDKNLNDENAHINLSMKEKLMNEFKARPDMLISWNELVERDAIKKNDADLDSKLEELETRLSKIGKQMK